MEGWRLCSAVFFVCLAFTFQRLDKLWSQVSSLSPPARAFSFDRA